VLTCSLPVSAPCLQCLPMVLSWHSSLTFGQSLLEGGIKPPAMLPACISCLELHLSSTAALQMETPFLTLSGCRSSFLVLRASVTRTAQAELLSPPPPNAACRDPTQSCTQLRGSNLAPISSGLPSADSQAEDRTESQVTIVMN